MLPKFSSRAFLAPMAGVSDPALRLQCKKMGAGLVVTEFTNIHSIVAKEKQLKDHFRAKLRVAPSFKFFNSKEIQQKQFPENSRKPITFIDKR